MLKLGIVSTFPPTQCGIATYTSDFIKSLKQKYPYIDIWKFQLYHDFKKNNYKKFFIRNSNPDDYSKVSKIINNSDIDLLDIQHEYKIFGKPDGENICMLLKNVNKPISTTLHTVNFELSGFRETIFYKIIKRSDLLFVFSQEAKHFINEKYCIQENKIVVIPHGVPTIDFCLPSEITKRNINSEELIFVSAGHMRETKGYDMSLEALQKVKNIIGDKFHYYIIGSNHPQNETAENYRKKLLKLVNELGLDKNVTFINKYLELNELINFIQLADICLLPYSRKDQSSSGILALMVSCGRPIVTTPFEFAKSCISEKSGIVAGSFLSNDFSKAILSIIKKQNIWHYIMNYNNLLGKSWNWEKVVNIYYSNYEKILR